MQPRDARHGPRLLSPDLRLYEDEEKVTAMPDVRVTTETAALQSCGPASTDTLSVSLSTSTDAVSSNEESGAATQVQILIFLLISCLACNEWPQLTDSAPSLSKKMMKKRRRKFERKELHPDLITMWRNANEICTPPAPRHTSPYPRVDWTRVNQRNLANLPKPQFYPVHGCAQDPTFYEPRKSPCPLGNPLRSLYDEAGAIPFGSELGFRTQAGVIAPGSHGELVSGYTWSPDYQDWVLMATIPRDKQTRPAFVSKNKFKKNKWPR